MLRCVRQKGRQLQIANLQQTNGLAQLRRHGEFLALCLSELWRERHGISIRLGLDAEPLSKIDAAHIGIDHDILWNAAHQNISIV